MPEAAPPGGGSAIGNDEQYRPVQAVGDQRVQVSNDRASMLFGRGCRTGVQVRA